MKGLLWRWFVCAFPATVLSVVISLWLVSFLPLFVALFLSVVVGYLLGTTAAKLAILWSENR